MATVTGKRKRENGVEHEFHERDVSIKAAVGDKKQLAAKQTARIVAHVATQIDTDGGDPTIGANGSTAEHDAHVYVQIVTGSYERILHGFSARIPRTVLLDEPAPQHSLDAGDDRLDQNRQKAKADDSAVTFSDTFLFAAHTSAIRCLALSPPTDSDKRILATGSSDERINLYSISTARPAPSPTASLTPRNGSAIAENPRNRPLGSLAPHDRAVTQLQFPSKAKLFSAAEDNTIAISRTRDWTVMSSVKAPIPKPQGRPSGDTASPGETPAGINDFAIHPSHKLMLSVGRGERCMRLWNLMTGKKGGVLNFDRDLLVRVGEGKRSSGEGRCILWDEAGETFVVGFERGLALFGMDSKPRAILLPTPSTKIHRVRLAPKLPNVLAVSTEDGRVMFFATYLAQNPDESLPLPQCECIAELGGKPAGITGRIKDFQILGLSSMPAEAAGPLLLVTASSDGAVRLWNVSRTDIELLRRSAKLNEASECATSNDNQSAPKQIGALLATLETGNRITCLGAFIMDGKRSNSAAEDEGKDNAASPPGSGDEG